MDRSRKILTDELIANMLEEDGVTRHGDLSHEVMFALTKEHFGFTIDYDWSLKSYDAYFYTETTADGYEVWVATDDDRRPSINDDIYYYESDWLEKMQDYLTDGCSIYYQDFADTSYEFQEIIENVYIEYYNDKKQELEDRLIDDGYERESTEAATEMV